MFKHLWEARRLQARDMLASGKHKIASIHHEIDKLLDLIVATDSPNIIKAYEKRIGQHEHEKALLVEKLANQAEPKGSFKEKLEPAL